MGCDIHSHIEYEWPPNREAYHFGSFDLGRNYVLFGILANVRSGGCLYPPRGLPDNISFTLRHNVTLIVSDSGGDRTVSREEADREDSCKGSSKMVGYTDDSRMSIWNRDYHSHSWLNLLELQQVQDAFKAVEGSESPMLAAVIAAMKSLDEWGVISRFVFYFDS